MVTAYSVSLGGVIYGVLSESAASFRGSATPRCPPAGIRPRISRRRGVAEACHTSTGDTQGPLPQGPSGHFAGGKTECLQGQNESRKHCPVSSRSSRGGRPFLPRPPRTFPFRPSYGSTGPRRASARVLDAVLLIRPRSVRTRFNYRPSRSAPATMRGAMQLANRPQRMGRNGWVGLLVTLCLVVEDPAGANTSYVRTEWNGQFCQHR